MRERAARGVRACLPAFRPAIGAAIVGMAAWALVGVVSPAQAKDCKTFRYFQACPYSPSNAAVKGGTQPQGETIYAPGSFIYPGSNTSIALHGYVKADYIYDVDATPFESVFAVAALAENQDGRFSSHVQESRIQLTTSTPTDMGELFIRIEMDMFAAGQTATDPFESKTNGFDFGLRHAYGKLGNLLVGNDWSTFQDLFAFASTLDFSGGNFSSFVRQPIIQWSQPFGNGHEWAISLENPQNGDIAMPGGPTFPNADTGGGNNTVATISDTGTRVVQATEQIPDIVARIQTNQPWGHLWLSGVMRWLTVEGIGSINGVNVDGATELGGGFQAVARFNVLESDSFTVTGIWGDGIGRYQNDLGYAQVLGEGLAAAYNEQTRSLETIQAWSVGAHYTHWWTGALRSTAVYGFATANTDDSAVKSVYNGSVYDSTQYAALNLIWSPVPAVNFGLEGLWGQRVNRGGTDLDTFRIQFSGQYLF